MSQTRQTRLAGRLPRALHPGSGHWFAGQTWCWGGPLARGGLSRVCCAPQGPPQPRPAALPPSHTLAHRPTVRQREPRGGPAQGGPRGLSGGKDLTQGRRSEGPLRDLGSENTFTWAGFREKTVWAPLGVPGALRTLSLQDLERKRHQAWAPGLSTGASAQRGPPPPPWSWCPGPWRPQG